MSSSRILKQLIENSAETEMTTYYSSLNYVIPYTEIAPIQQLNTGYETKISLSWLHGTKLIAVKEALTPLANQIMINEAFIYQYMQEQTQNLDYVIKYYGVSINQNNKLNIVMEYISDKDAHDWISSFKRNEVNITSKNMYTVLKNAAAAVKSLHEMDIIHCDLKLENFIYYKEGSVKLIDFGFAKHLDDFDFIKNNSCVGTLGYLAPETLNAQLYSKNSDMYAFGSVMYTLSEMLIPYNSDGKPLQFSYRTPAKLAELIQACWNEDPDSRPTASEVCDKLDLLFFESEPSTPPEHIIETQLESSSSLVM